jgi:hypothetical protein
MGEKCMSALMQTKAYGTELAKVRTASESNQPEILTDIYRDEHNIAIWRRTLSSDLLGSIDEFLKSHEAFKVAMEVTPQRVFADMRGKLQNLQCACELSENIAELVDMFCGLFDLKKAGLKLTVLDRAMCPRFHVDRVYCRLVTTYQGVATEWLPHNAVNRTKLGTGNNGLPDELSGLYENSDDIQQLDKGDVALLKGELWEGNKNAGLVHRSPAPKPNERRLLLTLDFA